MSLHLPDTRMGSLLAVNLLVVVCCSNAVTIQKPAPFCLLIKSERGSSQVSFLIHSPDTTASPLFYWSKWTSEKRLEGCFMSSDGSLVTRYRSLCRQERARDNEKPMQFNFSALLEDASLCEMNMHVNFTLHKERVNPGLQMDSRAKSRHKRAWVLPGTLWCGRGTSANDYEQLGMFVHADRCCREHDHCEHIIRSFSVNFGVFNPTLFTLSHCDCDRRFKQCLLNGNDTISNMIGLYNIFVILLDIYNSKKNKTPEDIANITNDMVKMTNYFHVFHLFYVPKTRFPSPVLSHRRVGSKLLIYRA
uniref:Phospholipase A2-like central domain-containing protein n=1 Tax=Sinocyclocheilus grahami TaxID=75366 RepID=A0A672P8H4_SINGR